MNDMSTKKSSRIKIIAFDLDGTLLDNQKRIPEENRKALLEAHEAGALLVPTTGRLFAALPEEVKAFPLHYAIVINGAGVYDVAGKKAIARAGMSPERTVELLSFLDTLPVAYDCYMDDWGYMTGTMKENIRDYVREDAFIRMVELYRKPVPELKEHIRETGHDVQKVQAFLRNRSDKEEITALLQKTFPDLIITSSTPDNIEINDRMANKGHALRQLAEYLGIPMEETMALGDGTNDLTMVREAGIGVAMENGHPDVKAAADYISKSNEENGVAEAVRKFCFI